MTPELQRIAIAEACGWTGITSDMVGNKPDHGGHREHDRIPDYLNDLNAMHEAEKVFDSMDYISGWKVYFIELIKVTKNTHVNGHLIITATASQRAEAFLKTIGKWKD